MATSVNDALWLSFFYKSASLAAHMYVESSECACWPCNWISPKIYFCQYFPKFPINTILLSSLSSDFVFCVCTDLFPFLRNMANFTFFSNPIIGTIERCNWILRLNRLGKGGRKIRPQPLHGNESSFCSLPVMQLQRLELNGFLKKLDV